MEKEGEIKEEILFLGQLIKTLEEAELRLERYYKEKNYRNFEEMKKFMLVVLKKITEVAR